MCAYIGASVSIANSRSTSVQIWQNQF